MPSSNAVGMTIRHLRIKKALTFLSGASVSIDDGASLGIAGDATVEGSFVVDGGLIRLVPQAAPPTPPTGDEEGHLYMDTDHKLYVHNGTAWVVVGSQTT